MLTVMVFFRILNLVLTWLFLNSINIILFHKDVANITSYFSSNYHLSFESSHPKSVRNRLLDNLVFLKNARKTFVETINSRFNPFRLLIPHNNHYPIENGIRLGLCKTKCPWHRRIFPNPLQPENAPYNFAKYFSEIVI